MFYTRALSRNPGTTADWLFFCSEQLRLKWPGRALGDLETASRLLLHGFNTFVNIVLFACRHIVSKTLKHVYL